MIKIRTQILLILLTLCFCVACSSSLLQKEHSFNPFLIQVDSARLLDGQLLLGEPVAPAELPQKNLLEISPEIKGYLDQLPSHASPLEKWELLVDQFRGGEFAVEYASLTTLPVAETFRRRKGNCLSVTMLLVAMAREIGVDASFNQVSVPPMQVDQDDEVVVNFRHINLAAELPAGRQVIDFGVIDFDIAFPNREVPDRVAFAQFYSNTAAESMLARAPRDAFINIRKALELSPGNSDFWVNLGVLYERGGLGREAGQAYTQALQLAPANLVAARNLARILKSNGDKDLALALLVETERRRRQDPDYMYFEARGAYRSGRYSEARRLLERAVSSRTPDHRLHFLLGVTNFQLRDFSTSKRHLVEAFALVRDPQIKRDYERQLSELKKTANL